MKGKIEELFPRQQFFRILLLPEIFETNLIIRSGLSQ